MVSGALSSEEGGQKTVQQVIPIEVRDRPESFRDAQKEYKKELERAGSHSWQKYCSEVDSLSDTAVLEGLITAHFPDNQVEAPRSCPVPRAIGCDWATAKKIVTLEKLRWAISTFVPFKAPGSDWIYSVLLQKGMRVLARE